MSALECVLNGNRTRADGNITAGTTLLKGFHVVDCAVAEELGLVLVEGGGYASKCRGAWVEPAGTLKAVPWLCLDDNMRAGLVLFKVRRHYAPEAREYGCDSEGAQQVHDA